MSDLTTNGGFSSDTGWTKGTGWSIASGKATFAGHTTTSSLSQNQSVTSGTWYFVTFTLSSVTAGSLTVYLAGTAGTARSDSGTFTEWVKAGSGSNPKLVFTASSTFRGSLDDVSVTDDKMSIRELALTTALAQLNDPAKPSAVPAATRSHAEPYLGSDTSVTLLSLRDEPKRVGGKFGPLDERELTFAVECRTGNDRAENALDPSLQWVAAALSGSTLGGNVFDTAEVSTEWGIETRDRVYVLATVTFSARYACKKADLTAAS